MAADTLTRAWADRADELAHWGWDRLVNRADVWGAYRPLADRGKEYTRRDGTKGKLSKSWTAPPKGQRGRVSLTPCVLGRHFAATAPEQVVGLHTTSPDNTCLWGAVEVDRHGETSSPAAVNWTAVRSWYDQLHSIGFRPLLTDSNGAGGFHLRALFRCPAPAAVVHNFFRWLTRDHQRLGLSNRPECFPKQPAVTERNPFGNWLRLPGRHHTREHWSRVWDGGRWLAGAEAVAAVLALSGDDPGLMFTPRVEAYLRKLPNLGEGQGRDDVGYNFAAFLVRDLALPDEVARRWLERWDANNRPPKGAAEIDKWLANAHQYGQRPYGSGRAAPSRNGLGGPALPPAGDEHDSGNRGCGPQILTNFEVIEDVRVGRPGGVIAADLARLTGGWPRRLGPLLFAEEADHRVTWLEGTDALFAFAGRRLPHAGCHPVQWANQGRGVVTKAEFYRLLQQTAEEYEAVETAPHEPPRPRHWYAHPALEGGDGRTLALLLDRFRPATAADRQLILSLALTLVWGGPPGQRPLFVIGCEADGDEEKGRGFGKTTLPAVLARPVGGAITTEPGESFGDLKKRLLSPEALSRRVLLLDNLKSLRYSSSELESLVTADVISGHRLYQGEGRRPNTLTVVVTANAASLSKDLAQRSVPIMLARPAYDPDWLPSTLELIDHHRLAILGDLAALLRRSPARLDRVTRWATWEREVLARTGDPTECQRVIAERQGAIDDDTAEAALVREQFVALLRRREHDPDTERVWISSQQAAAVVNEATGQSLPTNKATRFLNTLPIRELRKSDRSFGNGYVWTGPRAAPDAQTVGLRASGLRVEA